jgi:hypothetical protein
MNAAGTAQNGRSTIVKSGKAAKVTVTPATVRRLERAGSSESAKIARKLVDRS